MKSYLLSEVDSVAFYAQKERNLSEFNLAKMARGVGFEPTSFWVMDFLSACLS